MICKVCGSEFNIENFDVCPYCMTPVIEKDDIEQEIDIVNDDVVCDAEDEYNKFADTKISELDEDFVITEEDLVEECDEEQDPEKEILIEDLGLSVRATNVFKRANIFTLNEMIEFLAMNSISDLRNAGEKTVKETEEFMEKLRTGGISFDKVTNNQEVSDDERTVFDRMSVDAYCLSLNALIELGLSSRTVSLLSKSGIRCCGELRFLTKRDLLKFVGKRNWERILLVAEYLENDIISLLNIVLDNHKDSRDCEVFLRRAKGETLQEIADNQNGENAITRERVRQIENTFAKRIAPFIKELFYILKDSNKYVLGQDLLDVFDDDDYDQILLYACKAIPDFEYFDFADLFVENKETTSLEAKLFNVIEGIVGEGVDLYENMDEIDSALSDNGMNFLDMDSIVNLLRKYNYHMYGNFASKGKGNYAAVCMYIIRKEFSDGIKLSQSTTEQSEDLIKLRKIAEDKYPGVNIPSSDRSLSSTLVRTGLILRGRGTYILPENVLIDETLLGDIKKYIDEKPNDRVFYNEIFADFEGALNVLCGIDNYNYLHGVLAMRYPDEYEYGRDSLLKNDTCNSQADSVADRIYSYIYKMGRPVSKTELTQEFRGFSNIMLTMPFVNDSRLLQWDYNYYSCTGILEYCDEDITKLEQILARLFENNMGYASDSLLFNSVKAEYNDFLLKNKIESEINLHYVVANLFSEKFDFRRPHIAQNGKVDISSTKSVALYLLGSPEKFKYAQFMDLVERMGWSKVTAAVVFSDLEEDYVRISDEEYIKSNSFDVPQAIKEELREMLNKQMEDGIFPLLNIDFDEFPEWEFPWNDFLIETVIKRCFGEFEIIQPTMRDRRFQRGIAVRRDSGLTSYSAIIATKMKSLGYDALPESKFLSFLLVNNLARKVIPNELSTSECIQKVGNNYCIVND